MTDYRGGSLRDRVEEGVIDYRGGSWWDIV